MTQSKEPESKASTTPPLVSLKRAGAKKESPNLDRLSVIDDEGHRTKLYPAEVAGRFTFHRRWSRWLLLAFGFALPWIPLNGRQAVLLDIPGRQFHFFWLHLNAQDVPLFFFGLSGVGFILIVTSALFGRVWCGWACPHTVVLEGLFRPIEVFFEGQGNTARNFDLAPWTVQKVLRKIGKWIAFFALAFALAHTFLAYFVSGRTLIHWFTTDPRDHWTVFLWAAAATGIMLFNFGWFREQLCLIICPYGRMQSALQDDDTLVVGYDKIRGEPRGKASNPESGACVDCHRCVAVCPTGIDIRNGLQMECIGCAACIDACDSIMDKLHRPRGLIRYDSQRGLDGAIRKFLRPRLAYYVVAGFLGLGVATTLVSQRDDVEANVVRVQGSPYEIIGDKVFNRVMVHVIDKSDHERHFEFAAASTPNDVVVFLPQPKVTITPLADARIPIMVSAPRGNDVAPVDVLLSEDGEVLRTLTIRFISPSNAGAEGALNAVP